MNFRESFNNFFRPASSENEVRRTDDLTDYDFLFSSFEKKFTISKNSPGELRTLLHDLDATFSETGIGKDHFQLIQERDSLKSVVNPPGEVGVDLGRMNILDQQISEIEKLEEFVQYKKLKADIEHILNNQEQDTKKVA